jgi:hypothetical protein
MLHFHLHPGGCLAFHQNLAGKQVAGVIAEVIKKVMWLIQ